MSYDTPQKVNPAHLKRNAYLYVRQSTPRQVFENLESGKRQYALRQRAIALGWAEERIIVIDTDQGHSGASVADREGFQRLVSEVGIGHAGIVLGLEVSRLARNCTDWHRLLEICALTDTLILDEDGLYDPAHFNDRLLLGLKGSMSEAKLHVLRARLQGGILSKARRGELYMRPPVGLVYDSEGALILDPDQQVQQSLRWLFDTFRRTGSASAAARAARQQGVSFPRRCHTGPRQGDLIWGELRHGQVLSILHNPRYAGAFVYGRHHTRKKVDGKTSVHLLPRDQWTTLIPGAHPAYLSWEEYEQNQKCLPESAQAIGADRRKSPPREGPALLQGLVLCGRCGNRMTVRYHSRRGRLYPEYVCQREGIEQAQPICQCIPGAGIDQAMSELLVEAFNPVVLEVNRAETITLQIRFKGGAHKTLNLPLLLPSWQCRMTPKATVQEIDHLLDHHTHAQIAALLNERGMLSGSGKAFHSKIIARIQLRYGLKPRYDRLREAGLLTLKEMAKVLGITPAWAKIWHHHGLVRGHAYSDKNECLYEHPGKNPPQKAMGVKLDRRVAKVVIDRTKEVQCEA